MRLDRVGPIKIPIGIRFTALALTLFCGGAGQRNTDVYPPSWPKADYRTPRYIEASQQDKPLYKNEPLPAPARFEPIPVDGQGR